MASTRCSPGGGGPETPWHQDEAFRSPDFVYKELSIWLALQPATLENGCMQFIPGPTNGTCWSIARPAATSICTRWNAAATSPAIWPWPSRWRRAAARCTTRALHHTGANTSDAPRLAYILIYNTPPVYKPGRREFPWLEGRWTDSQTRKKEWHRRGGLAVDLVRRLPAIRLTSPRWLAWATIRAVNKVWPR